MTNFIALLRAVNVGGTGLLPMAELAALCAGLGHENVRTYLASGNVLFRSTLSEAEVRSGLERALAQKMRKAVDVMVRTGTEMQGVLDANPFPAADPRRLIVGFLNEPAPNDFLGRIRSIADEEVRILGREIYLHYRAGIGRSKLKLPASPACTGRNLSTVARLAELAR